MLHIEFHRKHRPSMFKDMIGQDKAIAAIKKMVASNKVPRALLISGPSGCGKTTIARILQKKLDCHDKDYFELNCASSRGIDTVRDINQRKGASALRSSRIWVLDECHQLTKDAQSGLLKILEDPPDHAYFILCTTDKGKIITTVQNRCSEIRVESIKDTDLRLIIQRATELEKLKIKDKVIDRIIEVSKGSARQALVNLEKISLIEGTDEQCKILLDPESERVAIDIVRALMAYKPDPWTKIAKMLSELEDNPETLRLIMLGYARAMLLKPDSKQQARDKAYYFIQVFESPLYDAGGAAVLAARCYDAYTQK